MTHIRIRNVSHEELLPEEEILQRGFACHTIDHYPEPARSYHLAYYRLERVREQNHLPAAPLLIHLPDGRKGVIACPPWPHRIGVRIAQKVSSDSYEIEDHITFLYGEDVARLLAVPHYFVLQEIVVTPLKWS